MPCKVVISDWAEFIAVVLFAMSVSLALTLEVKVFIAVLTAPLPVNPDKAFCKLVIAAELDATAPLVRLVTVVVKVLIALALVTKPVSRTVTHSPEVTSSAPTDSAL